jgi:hypothetical protein
MLADSVLPGHEGEDEDKGCITDASTQANAVEIFFSSFSANLRKMNRKRCETNTGILRMGNLRVTR